MPEHRHHPTIIIKTTSPAQGKNLKTSPTYSFDKTNFKKLNELLLNINWHDELSFNIDGSNFDDILKRFYGIISNLISETVPKHIRKKQSGPPWNSPTLCWLKNRKNRLLKKYKKSCNPTIHYKYLVARSKFNIENSKSYKSYLSKIKSNINKNPKMFYNFVNSKRKVTSYPTAMNGILYSDDAVIFNVLADFLFLQDT